MFRLLVKNFVHRNNCFGGRVTRKFVIVKDIGTLIRIRKRFEIACTLLNNSFFFLNINLLYFPWIIRYVSSSKNLKHGEGRCLKDILNPKTLHLVDGSRNML